MDDPAWIGRAKALGIHTLITNNPARSPQRLDATHSSRSGPGRLTLNTMLHVRIKHVSCIIVRLVIFLFLSGGKS